MDELDELKKSLEAYDIEVGESPPPPNKISGYIISSVAIAHKLLIDSESGLDPTLYMFTDKSTLRIDVTKLFNADGLGILRSIMELAVVSPMVWGSIFVSDALIKEDDGSYNTSFLMNIYFDETGYQLVRFNILDVDGVPCVDIDSGMCMIPDVFSPDSAGELLSPKSTSLH